MEHVVKLIKTQRTVVESRGQAETVFHEVLLAGAVAAEHGIDLRHGDVALVNDHQVVLGEEVEQAIWFLAGLPAIEIARVVLYAGAVAKLFYHFHVVFHAFLYSLCLDVVANLVEVGFLLHEVILNHADGIVCLLL